MEAVFIVLFVGWVLLILFVVAICRAAGGPRPQRRRARHSARRSLHKPLFDK